MRNLARRAGPPGRGGQRPSAEPLRGQRSGTRFSQIIHQVKGESEGPRPGIQSITRDPTRVDRRRNRGLSQGAGKTLQPGDGSGAIGVSGSRQDDPERLRSVRFFNAARRTSRVFLTHNFTFPAPSVASLYPLRWQGERFFQGRGQPPHGERPRGGAVRGCSLKRKGRCQKLVEPRSRATPYLDPPGSRGLGIFPSPRERSREGSFPPPDFTCGSAPWLSLLDSPWAPQAQPLTPSIPILRCHRFWPALQVQIAPAREPLVVNLRQHG